MIDPLAQAILEGRMPPGSVAVVTAEGPEREDDPGIVLRREPPMAAQAAE